MQDVLTIVLSSSGAVTNVNGGQFITTLPEPIRIPSDIKRVQCKVIGASIWNGIPNIETDCELIFETPNTGVVRVLIPKGQYSVTLLESTLNRSLQNLGINPSTLILAGDDATGKIYFDLATIGSRISFFGEPELSQLLGFPLDYESPLTTMINQVITAPNVAQFNNVNTFQIHSTITAKGILVNNKFTQLVAIIPVTAAPGSLIIYDPTNPQITFCRNLIGSSVQSITSWLTNEKGEVLDTNGESWSYVVELKWE